MSEEFWGEESDAPAEKPAWQPPPMPPMDEAGAEEYLQQRVELEFKIGLIRQQAEAKIAPIAAELNHLNATHGERLERYIRAQAAETGNRTFAFWGGTCKLTRAGGGPVVSDEREAIEYARENQFDHLIKPEEIRKGDYQKYAKRLIEENGEMIPGIEIQQPYDSFSISKAKE